MNVIEAKRGQTLTLGRMGENKRTQIVFDVSDWLEEYPGGTIGLNNRIPDSGESYPIAYLETEDGKAIWTVTSSELTRHGYGKCQLTLSEDEVVAKDAWWDTLILESLDGSGTSPEPWEDWKDYFISLKDEAEDAAEAAEDAMEAVQDLGVVSNTLPEGSSATVTKTVDQQTGAVELTFGIPKGDTGEKGDKGDPGYPTDTQVAEAVDAWLDDHPEATTTVEDNSLTEAKLTSATRLKVMNDYATPEMYGAVGDGETDDLQAIQDMFDSDYTVFRFSNKTYLVNGSIDVEKKCDIYFDHTTIKEYASKYIRDFEYVISFSATEIHTYGSLMVACENSVNIGVYLDSCGKSVFDDIGVSSARIWGVSTNVNSAANNGIIFNSLHAARCGAVVYAKAKYVDSTTLSLTNITSSKTFYEYFRTELFGNEYRHSEMLIDDSGYTSTNVFNRRIFWKQMSNGSPIELDESDPTKGTFTSSSGSVPSGFADGDNGRSVIIPIGGGVNLASSTSEGVITIHKLVCQTGPVGARIIMGYGGNIGSLITEYISIPLITNALVMNINYMYLEAQATYYNSKFNNAYDKIVCITPNSNSNIFVNNAFTGGSSFPFMQGNCISYNSQVSNIEQFNTEPLQCPQYYASRKCAGVVVNAFNNSWRYEVDEFTPSEITIDSPGYSSNYRTITIGLKDLNAYRTNRFQPMKLYIRTTNTAFDNFTIGLTNDLITAGYTIQDSVDNVFTIHPSEYGNFCKATIILFPNGKKFYVKVEPLFPGTLQTVSNLVTSLSNASTDTQYPSAKCVYDLIGDVETLLSGI